MRLSDEDKQVFRVFYRTLATESGATVEQVDFYKMVLKGNAVSRKKFAQKYASKYLDNAESLPPIIKALLLSEEKLTREDIAVLTASYIAPKVMSWLDKILKKIFPFLY
jgi:hypothetical protein